MKVLFVASGNKKGGRVSAFVQSQFDSLQKEGLDMLMFPLAVYNFELDIKIHNLYIYNILHVEDL